MKDIGIDIVSIDRISKAYNKYNKKFLLKILTPSEIKFFNKIANYNRKIYKLAGIFASKEAVIKCFNGKISFKDIEIRYKETGKPYAIVNSEKILLSISHEKSYAIAVAFRI